jgi:quinol monooxygenase YgiN
MTEWLVHAKPLLFGALMLAAFAGGQARAEERQAGYVQIAELDVDPAQLESYEAAAKEQIETAIRVEPGVLALYSVADKNNASHIRVFEMYRDLDAYKAHLETAHFKKYKAVTGAMVRSLNLVPVKPIILGAKGQ